MQSRRGCARGSATVPRLRERRQEPRRPARRRGRGVRRVLPARRAACRCGGAQSLVAEHARAARSAASRASRSAADARCARSAAARCSSRSRPISTTRRSPRSADVCVRLADGMICTNTTLDRLPGMNEAGGLSGKPLMAKSTRVLAQGARACRARTIRSSASAASSPPTDVQREDGGGSGPRADVHGLRV